jgi:hypothetical protein
LFCGVVVAGWAATRTVAPPAPAQPPAEYPVARERLAAPEAVVDIAGPEAVLPPTPSSVEDPVPLSPKKSAPRPIKAAPEARACDLEEDWRPILRAAVGRLDQALLSTERPRSELDAALVEEGSLQKKIANGKTKADCLGVARELQAFRSRHNL